jgi:Domain of unknown function (DUF1929)/Legume lectin domain/Chitobiase/beta-hexosaminidase C-terminal domain/PKD domain
MDASNMPWCGKLRSNGDQEPSKRRSQRRSTRRRYLWLIAVAALLVVHAPLARGQNNVNGTWQTLSTLMPINPVHTVLMSNGKILIVSGSGNYPAQTTFMVGVWDPSTNTMTTQTQSWDMFCNGMVVLPDGRPFIVGGNLQYDPFHGWNRTTVYDPVTGKYADMEDMAHGRWYPTDTILGDGRLMTFSGLDENGNTNSQVEIYKLGSGWASPSTASWVPPLYPRMHLLPTGKVFYSGSSTQSRTFDPSSNSWSGVIATTNYGGTRSYGSSVLLPLTPANGYKPRVMIFGGGSPSTATTEIIDLSVGSPAWAYGPSMVQPRIEMNATLLPTGKILTVGGSLNDEDTSTASLQADLFDVSQSTVTVGSAGSDAFARLYHSVSLLLPDGTVWVAGGNPTRGSYEQHVEIYTPPYLYNSSGSLATRPSITTVNPAVIGYGTSFQVQTPDAANIASVVIMKNGAATHAFDMEQRLVGLTFSAGSGVLNVTGPPNGNTAPPGYYMIFLINTSGVPSIAKFVLVSKTPTDTAPKGTITSPASDILIAPGQSVTFAGTGTASSGSITGYSWSLRGGSPAKSTLANPGAITYSTAGTYTASFTVTDSAGNTDSSPPVRTITVATAPAPTLSSVSPNTGQQGKTNVTVVLTGSNFLSSPSCSFGPGTTINSCTYNSSTKITASINILASATVGARNVTVTNTDSQNSTLTNGFTVQAGTANPPPTITSVSPNVGTQGQSNISVVVTGTNFLPGPICDFDSDEGLTVTACTYNSATKVTATLSITSNAVLGGHDIVITDTDGQAATLVNGFTVNASSGGGGGISFGSGFTAGSLALNGNAALSGSTLNLTTTASTFQGSSAWFPTAVNIQSFTSDFSFQTTAGSPTADGLTFTLQGNSTTALGGTGGNLGYFGIGNSVAVKFDLYDNAGEGPDSTGLYLNGVDPTTPAVDMTSSGVDLHSGHVLKVHMTYDGTTLVMTITDATTAASFTQSWAVNIPSTVGANTAFAGFTGGTGGYTALQQILTWTMSAGSGGGGAVATPTFSLAAGTYLGTQTVTLNDTTSASTIFYTLDGTQPGTSVGGSTHQYSGALTVSSTETIKALATASGLTPSATASALYTIESQVATPTFLPAAGNYTSAQNVAISSSSGSSIYYTTNGNAPTTSSTPYGGPVTVSTSETLKAIAVQSGFFNSNVGTAAYTIGSSGGGGISFGSGFTAGSMVVNGNASISGTSLTITPNAQTQASSAWYPTAVNIQTFTTDFSFQTTAGSPTADGFTFTLQGNNTAALGGSGGSLGYFGIGKSVAVKFDLYSNSGEGVDSTGLYLNGVAPGVPAVDMTGSGIDLHSGHVFQVHMTYDGTNLAMTITDATTAASFTQSWAVNIPSTVGATTAFAGFTGGTGGYTALQQILTWTMSAGAMATVATPTFLPVGGSYSSTQNVAISTTTSSSTIYYTTNGNPPTTGSAVYSTPISVATSETLKALAVKSGSTNSAVGSASYTIGATPQINYSSGFTTTNLALNGNAALNGTRLQLTNTAPTMADASAWFTTLVNIQKFTTDFQFQLTQPNADGFTFAIQNNNTTALGVGGGELGYGPDQSGDPGIPNSVAVKFDLYDNDGEGTNSTGLYTAGADPTLPATTFTGGVNLHSGDIFSVHIVYDGTTLTMTITDTANTAQTYTQSWTVNIPSVVGANTAYVGFTGGTGGLTAKQEVVNWTYTVN